MDIRTPPFMVVDVSSAAWAALCQDQRAYDTWMGWLIEQGLDPCDMRRIEVYDRDSPEAASPVWARVTNSAGEVRTELLGCAPPMPVRMVVGTYPQNSKPSGKSDSFFENGHAGDPTPPFPSLSPREKTQIEEAEVQNAQRAEMAYRVFAMSHGMTDIYGDPLFPWAELARCCAQAWETTAAALAADVLGEQEMRKQLTAAAEQAEALGALAKALDALPERCPYHGSNTDPKNYPYPWTRQACCDAGKPAQFRKRAEQALAALRAGLADV